MFPFRNASLWSWDVRSLDRPFDSDRGRLAAAAEIGEGAAADLTDTGRGKEMAYSRCFLLLRDALFFRAGPRGRHRHAGRRRAKWTPDLGPWVKV